MDDPISSMASSAQALLYEISRYRQNRRTTAQRQLDSAALESFESTLALALSMTRTVQNDLVTIHRLPAEMLARIFQFVVDDQFQSSYSFPDWPTFASGLSCPTRGSEQRIRARQAMQAVRWVELMLVCRHWQDIMVNFPRLWGNIIVDRVGDCYRDSAKVCLQRSGNTPLRIYADNAASSFPGDIKVCISRLEELRMISASNASLAYSLHSLKSPAANLECLEISVPYTEPNGGIVLPVLFDKHTPRLKKLCLKGVLALNGNRFSGLAELIIFGQYANPDPSSALLLELIALLGDNPDLEELHIGMTDAFIGMQGSLPIPTTALIEFNRLRWLAFHHFLSPHVAAFLCKFKLPPFTTVRAAPLRSRLGRPGPPLLQAIPLDTAATLPNFQGITMLVFEQSFHSSRVMGFGSSDSSAAFKLGNAIPVSGVLSQLPIVDEFNSVSIQALPRQFNLSSLKSLWLSMSDDLATGLNTNSIQSVLSPAVLIRMFRAMTSLGHLIVSFRPVSAFLRVLAEDQPNGKDGVLCPNLRNVYLNGVVDLHIPTLLLFVWKRAEFGHPVQHLRISLRAGDGEDYTPLQKYVEKVEINRTPIRSPVSDSLAYRHQLWTD